MSPKREKPTADNLRENDITIFHKSDKSRWPDYVRKLESELVSSFAGLIPESVLEEGISWGPTGLPSGAIELGASGRAIMKLKEEKVEFAQEVNRRCQEILESGTDEEVNWCGIWRDIFHKIVIEGKRGQTHIPFRLVTDKLFTAAAHKHLFDVQKCRLTYPKPDYTLGFTTFCHTANDADGHKKSKCFDQVVLDKLLKDPNTKILSSPFSHQTRLCFPWAIFEGKSMKRAKARISPLAECQVANAGVGCLRILEKLKKGASLLQGHSRKKKEMSEALSIPCFTCHGGEWYLWICYRSGYNNDGMPTYNLDKVFEGNMNEMWSCMQLLHIVENLKNWALGIFKPWVNEHLSACIRLMNQKKPPQLINPEKLPRQDQCPSPHRDEIDEDGYSDRDSAIVVNDREEEYERDKEKEYLAESKPSLSRPPGFLPQGRIIEFHGGGFSEDDASQSEDEFNDSGFVEDWDDTSEEEEYRGTNKREEQTEKKPEPLRRSNRIKGIQKYENFSYQE